MRRLAAILMMLSSSAMAVDFTCQPLSALMRVKTNPEESQLSEEDRATALRVLAERVKESRKQKSLLINELNVGMDPAVVATVTALEKGLADPDFDAKARQRFQNAGTVNDPNALGAIRAQLGADYQGGYQMRQNITHSPYPQGTSRTEMTYYKASSTVFDPATTIGQFALMVAPVGEYGPTFHRTLAATTATMFEILMESGVNQEVAKTDAAFTSWTDFAASRGTSERIPLARAGERNLAVISPQQQAILEGILTIYQSLSLLMQNKVGDLTADQLLHSLLEARTATGNAFVAQFAGMTPLAMVGPWAWKGMYVPHPIALDANGRPDVSPEFRQLMDSNNEKLRLQYAEDKATPITGLGCPFMRLAGGNQSGIQRYNQLFLAVYDRVANATNPH